MNVVVPVADLFPAAKATAELSSRLWRSLTMIWIYLTVVLVGFVITVRLVRQRSRHAYTAGTGVVLGIFAVLTGFSIGFLVAPVAALLVVIAASALRPRDHLA